MLRLNRTVSENRVARLLSLAASAGLATAASAQLAPPPTEAPPPPAPTEPQIVRPSPPSNPGGAGRGAPRSAGEDARGRLGRDPSTVELPPLPYDSLVTRDADGHVQPLDRNPHLAALSVNPMMDDSTEERSLGVIAARRDKVERRVAENVDLIQQVLDGAIEKVDLSRPDTIRGIIDVVRPFQELGHLSDDLKEQGILNDQQWAFNWKIAQEYTAAYQKDVMDAAAENTDPNAPSPQTVFTHLVMHDFMREPIEVYNALLVEGAGRIDDVMGHVTLTGDQQAVAGLVRGVKAAGDDEARRSAMQAVVTALTPEQRKAFVQAILETR